MCAHTVSNTRLVSTSKVSTQSKRTTFVACLKYLLGTVLWQGARKPGVLRMAHGGTPAVSLLGAVLHYSCPYCCFITRRSATCSTLHSHLGCIWARLLARVQHILRLNPVLLQPLPPPSSSRTDTSRAGKAVVLCKHLKLLKHCRRVAGGN